MVALNNERVLHINFIFLSAVLTLQPYNSYMYSSVVLYFG